MGFVLADASLVEVENICPDPEHGFEVSGADLVKHEHTAVATWHTHPGASSNLSANDYRAFSNYRKLKHYIIGTDGVSCFAFDDGLLVKVDGA